MNIRTRQARGERGLVVTAPVVKRRQPQRRSDETRHRMGATRLGIPYETYAAHIQAGERWCSNDRQWEPKSRFGRQATNPDGLAGSCLESACVKSREWQRQHRPPKRQEVSG